MWLGIGMAVLMIVLLLVVILVWAWTGPIIALVVFAAICALGASAATAMQRRRRGL